MTRYEFTSESEILFIEDDRGVFAIELRSREVYEDLEGIVELYKSYGIAEQLPNELSDE